MRMFENQLERDAAVLNADDPEVTRRMPSRPHIFWFSRQKRVAEGAFLRDDQIIFRARRLGNSARRGATKFRCAASTMSKMFWPPAPRPISRALIPAAIASGVKTFRGVEHRLEFVAEIGGVEFYNDSKATNVDAALKAIEAFPGPLIVILGGKDKGSPYTPLREPLRQRARAGDSDRRGRGKNRRGPGRRRPDRTRRHARSRRASWRSNARSRATWSCSRRRAPASISSRITSSAAASSSNSSRSFEQQFDRERSAARERMTNAA